MRSPEILSGSPNRRNRQLLPVRRGLDTSTTRQRVNRQRFAVHSPPQRARTGQPHRLWLLCHKLTFQSQQIHRLAAVEAQPTVSISEPALCRMAAVYGEFR